MTTPHIIESTHEIIETTKVQMFTPKVVVADLLCAIAVGGSVAIPISIIDFSIMMTVAGLAPNNMQTVRKGVQCLFKRPKNFFFKDPADGSSHFARVYQLCASVYFTTYLTANWARSFSEGFQKDESNESVAAKCGLTSSVVNVGGTIVKDSGILLVMRKIEENAGKTPTGSPTVPMLSRMGFGLRDTCTCVAAFTVVPLFRDYLKDLYPEDKERGSGLTHFQAQTISNLFTPCSIQFATTAIHIPAIIYQREYDPMKKWGGPQGYSSAIVAAVKRGYVSALKMRLARIFVAFGIGGLGNADLRPRLLKFMEPDVFKKKVLLKTIQ